MRVIKVTIFILSILFCHPFSQGKAEEQKRAMTFLDVIQMRSVNGGDISPDGKFFIYKMDVPDWEKNRRFSDIYITPIGGKTKQMTFTKDKNESSPKWYKDGSFFAFLSNRSEDKNQIYFMRPDGGEARKVTDDRYGVSSYQWSRDGKYLAYKGGKSDGRQIWIMPGEGGKPEKLIDHKTSIDSYFWNPNSKKIYFVASDSVDLLNKDRKKKKFDVVIKDEIKIPSHLWEIDIETKEESRLTGGNEYSVLWIVISDDGTKIAFRGSSTKRYASREIEVYLLDLNTNTISRITNNSVNERRMSFSPNSKWLAFPIPDVENEIFKQLNINIIPSEGGEAKKLLNDFDYGFFRPFWSDDSRYIYFTSQVGVNSHLFKVSIDNNQIEQITNFSGFPFFAKDKDTGKFLVEHVNSENPRDIYCSMPKNLADRDKWIKLTDANPQAKEFLLGKYETIRWNSTDGTTIEGLLIKPVNYDKDRKYPLIVQIHGGPHDACVNKFSASCYDFVHIFSANDYVVFQPNYRGSTGYGEKFMTETEITGDFFELPFDDIMTGVDYLIERGIVHPDSMGLMGWSAGGAGANMALVSTDRFKAISTGAGALGHYDWENNVMRVCPLLYMKNAKTPTLIHFGEDDPIMPRRDNEIVYKALKGLGVPTEFIVYPNTGHLISNMRYKMVKMQAEFNWFEKWIRGKKEWIDWKKMIETLKKEER
jgi:dipeptidyl aminopeptidase/acylaminoacyl peptidase